jgi:3-oxoacyl-[acyl-carrier protein] reductase
MEISEKCVIVTGGAGGIGNKVVEFLLEKNALVAAVDWNKDGLDILKMRFSKWGTNLRCYCGNVGDFKFVQEVAEEVFKQNGKIDVLINNASILLDAPLISLFKGQLKKLAIEDWEKTMASNLNSVFYFSREVAEKMILKRTRGVIVNVSSISASGNRGQTAYAAAKAGVNALTTTWASELASFGIRVVGVAPGMTDTDMPRNAMPEKILSSWVKQSPAQRMGQPAEIAEGVLFVIANDFFQGRVLEIDGGLRM